MYPGDTAIGLTSRTQSLFLSMQAMLQNPQGDLMPPLQGLEHAQDVFPTGQFIQTLDEALQDPDLDPEFRERCQRFRDDPDLEAKSELLQSFSLWAGWIEKTRSLTFELKQGALEAKSKHHMIRSSIL